jgi:autotransporter family porin
MWRHEERILHETLLHRGVSFALALGLFLSGGGHFPNAQASVPCTTACYVNATTGNDANNGDTPATAKRTIQAGINAVSPSGIVHVHAGTYTENLNVPKPMTLDGAGNSSKLIPAISNPNCGGGRGGSLCPGGSNLILIQANNVTIRDLLLDGNNPALTGVLSGGIDVDARNGIITDHNLGVFNNLTVDGVTVKNIFLRGIYASSGGSFDFHGNSITNVQGSPSSIAMFNFGGAGIMANNDVSWANDAISSNHSRGVRMLNNTVTHSQSGLHTDNAGDGGGTPDLIQGNRVSDCQIDSYGIFVFVPYIAPTVEDNTMRGCAVAFSAWGGAFSPSPTVTTVIRDNVFDGKNAPVSGSNTSDGIYVTTDQIGFGDNNTSEAFINNSVRNFDFGLQVTQKNGKTSTVTVDRSRIAKNDTGLDNEASMLSVTNSCIQQNGDGFVNRSLGVTVAHRNSIKGNSQFAVDNLAGNVLNAENNWWGTPTGAKLVGPNRINSAAAVDAVPFLTSDDDTCKFNGDTEDEYGGERDGSVHHRPEDTHHANGHRGRDNDK